MRSRSTSGSNATATVWFEGQDASIGQMAGRQRRDDAPRDMGEREAANDSVVVGLPPGLEPAE